MPLQFWGNPLLRGRVFQTSSNQYEQEELDKVVRMSEINMSGFFKAIAEKNNNKPYKRSREIVGQMVKSILLYKHFTGHTFRKKSFFSRKNKIEICLNDNDYSFHPDFSVCLHNEDEEESTENLNALFQCIKSYGKNSTPYHFDFNSFNSQNYDPYVREWLDGLGWEYDPGFDWNPGDVLVLTEKKRGSGSSLDMNFVPLPHYKSVYR